MDKVKQEYPPNYETIKRVFPDVEQYKPVFAYGDFIYSPFEKNLRPDIIAHEELHLRQQNGQPELWWNKYLSDKEFRLGQEIEAYGFQLAFVRKYVKDTHLLSEALYQFAHQLSSPQYGNIIEHIVAEAQIRLASKRHRI